MTTTHRYTVFLVSMTFTLSAWVLTAWPTETAVVAAVAAMSPGAKQEGYDRSPHQSGAEAAAASTADIAAASGAGSVDIGSVHPIPRNAPVRRFVAVAGQDGTRRVGEAGVAGESRHAAADGSAAGSEGGILVYENTLSTAFQGPPANLPLTPIGDDIATTAMYGCNLDRYVVRVTGDLNGDGAVAGDLAVDVALYPACPRANVSPSPPVVAIAGTQCRFDIPGAEAGGVIDLACVMPGSDNVPLPTNLWVGIRFSRADAGVAIGAPALKGFSLDQFDHPARACGAVLTNGGFAAGGRHSSFYTRLYVREPCGNNFIGYKNTRQFQQGYSPGAQVRFADDIHLGTDRCNMVAYEVSFKGTISGTVVMDLRTGLSSADPENGNVVPGTRVSTPVAPANQVFLARVNMPAPIELPQDLYVSFRTTSTAVGPILSGLQGGPGTTADVHFVYRNGAWQATSLTGWDAFDVAILCEGEPPIGACCDTSFPENRRCIGGPNPGVPCVGDFDCDPNGVCGGEAVCREVPEMNCPAFLVSEDFQPPWAEGATCESEPFPHTCGQAKCCTPDDSCVNTTAAECAALSAPGDPLVWLAGRYCETDEQACPWYACLRLEGECSVAHDAPGCRNPFCCSSVCDLDPWCCRVEWDRTCVEESLVTPDCQYASNDSCTSHFGTPEILANGSTFFSNAFATLVDTEPPFCCVRDMPEAQGFGSVWFKFVATHESASVRTCHSHAAGDSMVQVFAVGDPTDDTTACSSLTSIGCSDDEEGCGDSGRHARVCVDGLIPGATYYLMVASKTPGNQGLHQLDIVSPCQFEVPFATADCNASGTQDGCDVARETSADCNTNGNPDECDLSGGSSADCNGNRMPDECDIVAQPGVDCQPNGIPDPCDLASGRSADCNGDAIPDECSPHGSPVAVGNWNNVSQGGMAMDSELLVVANPHGGDFGIGDGTVPIFRREGVAWPSEAVLPLANWYEDCGGTGVGIANGWLLVGSPRAVTGPDHAAGAVLLFEHGANGWLERGMLPASDVEHVYCLGAAIATDADFAVVGAHETADPNDSSVPRYAAAYVFRREDNIWIQEARLVPGTRSQDRPAVAISGLRLLLGARTESTSGYEDSGVVHVYTRESGKWLLEATLQTPSPGAYTSFGSAVAIDGDFAVVSDHGPDVQAAFWRDTKAYVFRRDETTWVAEAELLPTWLGRTIRVGNAIGISGGSVVVGSVTGQPGDPFAFVFRRGHGGWKQSESLTTAGFLPLSGPSALAISRGLAAMTIQGDFGDYAISPIFLFDIESNDCNGNHIIDACDIRDGNSADMNRNREPDECECVAVADSDGDGDFDDTDTTIMLRCIDGPSVEPDPYDCGDFHPFDLDGPDGDVDLRDLAILFNVYNGECTLP